MYCGGSNLQIASTSIITDAWNSSAKFFANKTFIVCSDLCATEENYDSLTFEFSTQVIFVREIFL